MDYVFFDSALQSRFTSLLDDHAVAWKVRDDVMGGTIVSISDELAEILQDGIDACYDTLLDEQSALAIQNQGWIDKRLAGVQVSLPDGSMRTVALPPDLANRLLSCFSAEEVADLVNTIASSLRKDYDGPICCFPEGTP